MTQGQPNGHLMSNPSTANSQLPKSSSVHQQPKSFGWIRATYPSAIEFTQGPPGNRGLMIVFGVIGLLTLGPFGIWSATYGESPMSWSDALFLVFPLLSFLFLIFAIRFELFRPSDEPIIFDRKNRKVHRISRDVQAGLKGLFKPWPIRFTSYDWDLIDAQHDANTVTTGSTVTRHHALVLVIKDPRDHTLCVDQFHVGNSFLMGETMVAPLWEHIRRFMEEDGPHLPPGEELADMRCPNTWWQSMKAVFPRMEGQSFVVWLKDELPLALLLLTLAPLTLPIYLIWGTGNWLSHKTALPVRWPSGIQAAMR